MSSHDVTQLIAGSDWYAKGRIPSEARAKPELTAVLQKFSSADLAFLNLENPLTTRGIRAEKGHVIRANPIQIEDFIEIGVDIVSIANNHMLDYGIDGLFDTLDTLEHANIKCVGGGRNIEAARSGTIFESNGNRIGFLAFASTLPQSFSAAEERPGIAPIHAHAAFVVENPTQQEQPGTPPPVVTYPNNFDVDETCSVIRELKEQSDFVIVSAHWGVSGGDLVMDYQREVAHALVDAKCDLVLGHHPHRLHGVEHYNGVPIFYSLGKTRGE